MKRLIGIALAVLLVWSATPVVLAGTQGSCTPSGNVSLRLWENAIGDTSDGNDTLWLFCNHTAPIGHHNLNQITHTLPGDCQGPGGIGMTTWNDCVNSYTIWGMGSSLWRICWYTVKDYSGNSSFTSGPLTDGSRHDFPYFQDQISSIKVTNDGSC